MLEGRLFCNIGGWVLSVERSFSLAPGCCFFVQFHPPRILLVCFKTTPFGKVKRGNDQGCLFKNSKNDNPSPVIVVLQRPGFCPLSPCAIFIFPEVIGQCGGNSGCSSTPVFGRTVRISLHGSTCRLGNAAEVFLPDCLSLFCSGEIVSGRTEESSEIKWNL